MTDIPTIAFIGLPLLTGGIGIGLGAWWQDGNNSEGYWKAIAERKEKLATDNWNRFVDACKECNAIEEDYQEALASNRLLTDALQCKNERLERIAEKGRVSKSGDAVHLAKIAEGVA